MIGRIGAATHVVYAASLLLVGPPSRYRALASDGSAAMPTRRYRRTSVGRVRLGARGGPWGRRAGPPLPRGGLVAGSQHQDATEMTMNGRVCLVTGATSGIGRATAQALAGRAGRW